MDRITEIKERIRIEALARELGYEPNRAGFIACPFHAEKTASCKLYPETNTFKCYACDTKGDVITFYQKAKGLTTKEAIDELGKRLSLDTTRPQAPGRARYQKPIPAHTPAVKKPPRGVTAAQKEVLTALSWYCQDTEEPITEYLVSRGITPQTQRRFGIFSIREHNRTKYELVTVFSEDRVREAGLLDKNGDLIFKRHPIIFPCWEAGKIVYLQGRRYDENVEPKYINVSGVEASLFNVDVLREKGRVFLCEGAPDTIILAQAGHRAVGILGVGGFKPEHAERFIDREVILVLDNDPAGQAAVKRIAEVLLKVTHRPPKFIALPENVKDINELYREAKSADIQG